ncbi:cytochrome d ubiquinol oxidase subunit II [Rhodococcus sp. 15-649-1-2]|uniref:cytochrome d ubiquinol oxidase subunit II n=1 Tax=Nocardiaceae TaxID=85025 RepID=UPI000522E95E|nr:MULTISPECIES: cytochrome d ubiquinol oxidase subunit II [Rhodococcus]OZC86922.1 cytochrome d ubiquinol oxidase subunit II [Rhodococcus sp. 06-418-1B]OZD15362.1 cytochrome d ubiquinol oxidase subunit II [Rhodococcus sp. 06-156-4C]OZD19549.1 cytochrome d ubiquinol oxidase subunit II [Rhodococcus sp. 06-156-4a]OZD23138.1 cytochrome d ubiquinol oxidase subunit II [Rhodococcus sp. 06-156-3C]OZD25568.1 cytochrome d ubiquinol oxidase subunit II [Rhodococcus sp. 06-156-3b]
MAEMWFVIVAVLFVGYFLLEGFDFGVGMLMPIVGRRTDIPPDVRRRVVLNTIGPVWDGNEVWLITAGGALFAAFPDWYATLFSGFYLPLLLILVALILRIVAIEWRAKIDDDNWRRRCDWGIVFGSWVPAVLWGVAFANIVRGVEIDAQKQVVSSLFDLLNPYALLGGVTTAVVFALHGAVFLALKSADEIREDAVAIAARLAVPAVPIAGSFVLWTQIAYGKGWTWILVGLAAAALLGVVVFTRDEKEGRAFALTSIAVVSTVTLLFASLFPNVMPSTLDPAYNLTIANASSSPYTLTVMTWVAAFMTPVVILYQAWTYWVFRQRISSTAIGQSHGLKWAGRS